MTTATTKPQPQSSNALRSFAPAPILPQNVAELMALANVFYLGGMHPKGCTRPESVAAVIAYGLELGIRPATAVNCIHVTNGKGTVWGDVPLALVQASGLMENWKESIEGYGEDRTARCTLHRKGDPDGPREFTYSVAEARRMGLFMKGGKEGPWDRDTDWMLQLRARGRGLRIKFADVLSGLNIGETDDEAQGPESKVEVKPQPSSTSSPAAAASSSVSQSPVEVDGQVMIDEAQLAEITRLMPVWVKVYAPSGATKQEGIQAWKDMLAGKYGSETARKLTASQADELLALLRETEKSPTAGLFAPTPDAQQAQQPQQQQQPATAA
jgi:hypothetical protein